MSQKTPQASLDVKTEHLAHSANDALLRHNEGSTNLAEAIGHAYEIYRLQPHARDKGWLEAQIKIWNDGIEAHNKVVNDDSSLSDDDKRKMRRMKAEGRDGVSQFTALVKFLFKFDKPKNGSQVNKYTLALEWAHRHFAEKKPGLGMFGDVRDKIVEAGGLTQVVDEQRNHRDDPPDGLSAAEIEALDKEVVKSGRAVLKASPSKTSVDKGNAVGHDGLFLLIGRENGDKIEVAEVAAASAEDIDRLILNRRGANTTAVNEGLELIGRVLDLGKVVKEGKSKIAVNHGAVPGDAKMDIRRSLTMRPTDGGRSQLIVSAKRASASIIVHAVPKNGALSAPEQTVYMQTKDRSKFEDMFADWQRRRLYDLVLETNPTTKDGKPAKSPLKMTVSNKVLKDAAGNPKQEDFYWSDIAALKEKPLDRADSFQSNFAFQVSMLQLEQVYQTMLADWSAMQQAKKRDKTIISIDLDGKKLKFQSSECHPVDIEVETGNEDAYQMSFRASDLYEVFDRLRRQPTQGFTFKGDDTGMLEIAWEDELADYDVCLPMVTTEGTLNHKHFDKIRATD